MPIPFRLYITAPEACEYVQYRNRFTLFLSFSEFAEGKYEYIFIQLYLNCSQTSY